MRKQIIFFIIFLNSNYILSDASRQERIFVPSNTATTTIKPSTTTPEPSTTTTEPCIDSTKTECHGGENSAELPHIDHKRSRAKLAKTKSDFRYINNLLRDFQKQYLKS